MRTFGWDLPPGCTMNDIDPPERPCEVCGMALDDCFCPECPVCGEYGNPFCYREHGLTVSKEQSESLAKHLQREMDEHKADELLWDEMEDNRLKEEDEYRAMEDAAAMQEELEKQDGEPCV